MTGWTLCRVELSQDGPARTNPAARRPGNAVSGMLILDVDKARSAMVIKRPLGHGDVGIDDVPGHRRALVTCGRSLSPRRSQPRGVCRSPSWLSARER